MKGGIFSKLWRSHLVYDMGRNLKPKEKEFNFEEKTEEYQYLQKKLLEDETKENSIWKNIEIPVSYAIYKNRKES